MTDVLADASIPFRTEPHRDPGLQRTINRLNQDDYRPGRVVAESAADEWPGDLAGRLLLTKSRLSRSGHGDDGEVHDLFARMLVAVDGTGYFGPPLLEIVDEQQVACHGWVASGFLQYGLTFDDARAIDAARRVVDALLLPAVRRLDSYPTTRDGSHEGGPAGTATSVVGDWRLSTDTWCVLLTLNGLVPVWEVTRAPDIAEAIEGLLDLAMEVDLPRQGAQLHATLAAARNFARYGEVSGDARAVAAAASIYDEYVRLSRTLNWATYNWFHRDDSWTEPCAIVDSLGLAMALWRTTGLPRYLEDARRIERNALAFAQARDGSFGLDSIATRENPEIRPLHDDARWCCTIRGGLGIIDVRDRSVEVVERGIRILFPRNGIISVTGLGGEWEIKLDIEAEAMTLRVVRAPSDSTPLEVSVPLYGAMVHIEPTVGVSTRVPLPSRDVVRTVAHVGRLELVDDLIQAVATGVEGEEYVFPDRPTVASGASYRLLSHIAKVAEEPTAASTAVDA